MHNKPIYNFDCKLSSQSKTATPLIFAPNVPKKVSIIWSIYSGGVESRLSINAINVDENDSYQYDKKSWN